MHPWLVHHDWMTDACIMKFIYCFCSVIATRGHLWFIDGVPSRGNNGTDSTHDQEIQRHRKYMNSPLSYITLRVRSYPITQQVSSAEACWSSEWVVSDLNPTYFANRIHSSASHIYSGHSEVHSNVCHLHISSILPLVWLEFHQPCKA